MSIEVRFYTGYSKRINSTKKPANTDAFTKFDCTLKEGCNILNPEIEIYLSSGDPSGYNYAHIPSFGRYYFVSDWTYFHGTWTASLSVDVLASYKTEIGLLDKYVVRAASDQDYNIADGLYPVTTEATQTDTQITGGSFNLAGGFYILGLIGATPSGATSIGGINYYYLDQNQMNQFVSYLTSSTLTNLMTNASEGVTASLSKVAVNPIEYVSSCMYFPCDISSQLPLPATYIQPKIGWWDTFPITIGNASRTLGGQTSSMIKAAFTTVSFTLPTHPQASRGNYMNRAPYSEYIFHLDPFGDVRIPSELLFKVDSTAARTCKFTVEIDLLTGLGRLYITNNAGTNILAEVNAQIGVPIQLTQISTDLVGIAAGVGEGIWDGISGIFNDTIAQAGSMILNGIEAMHTQARTSGSGGGSLLPFESANLVKGATLRTIQLTAADEYVTEFGRPLYKQKSLSTLSGYVKCADGEHDVKAYDSEKTQISSYLAGGFFYE